MSRAGFYPAISYRPIKSGPLDIDEIFKKEAKVGLDDGAMFGESGGGFQRINLAYPKSILVEALERIRNAFVSYLK